MLMPKVKMVILFLVGVAIVLTTTFTFWNKHNYNILKNPDSQLFSTVKNLDSPLYSTDGFVRDCISHSIIRNRTKLETRNFRITPLDRQHKQAESSAQRQQFFKTIYKTHAWGGSDSNADRRVLKVVGSGTGSALLFAQEAMGVLHSIINELKVKLGKKVITILDIPCGDFQWMARFLQERTDVKYTGMDILPHLIENHNMAFKNDPNLRFIQQDIVSTTLDTGYDIIMCRMMLQHLTKNDILKVLHHFDISGSSYLLATTHPEHSATQNLNFADVQRFRYLNLEVPPVQLESPICMTRDGPRDTGPADQYLGLWSFPLKQVEKCSVKKLSKPPNSKIDFHMCG